MIKIPQLIAVFLMVPGLAFSQAVNITVKDYKDGTSYRGLSVVDDKVAWVSGSNGWVGTTVDGGNTWRYKQVQGFEKYDFRSLYAFDANRAVVANAGAPANILLTADGGQTWKLVYTNNDSAAFFDGMDFFDSKEGIIYGDPIDGKMLLLRTNDGGLTWTEFPHGSRPPLVEGEASFAASGTNIRCLGKSNVIIATGGKLSRLWISTDKGNTWRPVTTPILQGESSTGIFSFAYRKPDHLHIVGGNYLQDTLRTLHVFYTTNIGKDWKAPEKPTRGYRECVEYISTETLIATGPTGTDISTNHGRTWNGISDEKGFHVVRKARKGNLIIIAGGKGKIGVVTIKEPH